MRPSSNACTHERLHARNEMAATASRVTHQTIYEPAVSVEMFQFNETRTRRQQVSISKTNESIYCFVSNIQVGLNFFPPAFAALTCAFAAYVQCKISSNATRARPTTIRQNENASAISNYVNCEISGGRFVFALLSRAPQNLSNKRKNSHVTISFDSYSNCWCDRKWTIVYCILSVFVGNRTMHAPHEPFSADAECWRWKRLKHHGMKRMHERHNCYWNRSIFLASTRWWLVMAAVLWVIIITSQLHCNANVERTEESIPCQSAIAIQRGKSIKRCQTINHYYYYDKSLPSPDFHPQAIFEWSRSDVEQHSKNR